MLDLIEDKYSELKGLTSIDTVRFDLFEDRYRRARSLGLDIKHFLIEELNYIDGLLADVRETLKTHPGPTRAYDDIAKSLYDRYSHYPKVDLKDTPDEYCFLLGAVREFSTSFTPGIKKLGKMIKDRELTGMYHHFEYSYESLFIDMRGEYPKEFHSALFRAYGLKSLDDIHQAWHPLYKLMFNVLLELMRFVKRVHKREAVKENVMFTLRSKSLSFAAWREGLLKDIDHLMTNFRLKGLI